MKYLKLTAAQRKALPDTYGIPVADAYTTQQERIRTSQPTTYDLDFGSATTEMNTALSIGLENYGSGIASWKIPQVLKAPGSANKPTQMWHLYVTQVCGAKHTAHNINTAWKHYTRAQQATITKAMNDYLDLCLEYLQDY